MTGDEDPTGAAPEDAPDDALVRATLRGDEVAFARLARRYLRKAMAVALEYAGNREDAEDVVQDTFRRVLGNLERYDSVRLGFTSRPIRIADDDLCAGSQEETRLDDARARSQRSLHGRGSGDPRGKVRIHDVMPLIGAERRPAGGHAQHRLAAKGAHALEVRVPPERYDLQRQRVLDADALDELGAIRNDDISAGARRNNLFPQKSAARALQKVAFRVHFIGTVNGKVDRENSLERRQGHTIGESVVPRRS